MAGVRLLLLLGLAAATLALAGSLAGVAGADGPAGTDPSANFSVGRLPEACGSDPTGSVCVDASVQYLDQARASLGQPAYQLPGDFDSLGAPEQLLVLSNLDRLQYGLAPIAGLTAALDQAAAGGVQADDDPTTDDSHVDAFTSNWAGGFPNAVLAYEAWMYDDGPGSGNLDCTATSSSGCWGHRHDVLWRFDGDGPLALGAATGADPQGVPGYAMLLAQGDSAYRPNYLYTWSQAVTAGANGGSAGSAAPSSSGSAASASAPPAVAIASLQVARHRLLVRFTISPPAPLSCALTRRSAHGFGADHFRPCATTVTYAGLRSGRYRLRVRAGGAATVTRYAIVP
jgi:hypothetical protein